MELERARTAAGSPHGETALLTPCGGGGEACGVAVGGEEGGPVAGVALYAGWAPAGGAAVSGRFVTQGYKDVWAAVLFVVQLVGTVVAGGVLWATDPSVRAGGDGGAGECEKGEGGAWCRSWQEEMAGLRYDLLHLLPFVLLFSAALTAGVLALMRVAPERFVWFTSVFFVSAGVVGSVVLLLVVSVVLGAVLLAGCVALGVCLHRGRGRVKVAAALLGGGVRVGTAHWGTLVAGVVSAVLTFGYVMFACVCVVFAAGWRLGVVGGYGWVAVVLVMLALCVLVVWTGEVVRGVAYTGAAGVAATWYYAGEAGMPGGATCAGLRRAMTFSFGSVCLASAVSGVAVVVGRVLPCGCADVVMRTFNVYALSRVAVDGSGYREAARATYELVRRESAQALANEAVLGVALLVGAAAEGVVVGIVFGFFSSSLLFVLVAFAVAVMVHGAVVGVLQSCVTTLFVCYAERPDVAVVANPWFGAAMAAAVGGPSVGVAPGVEAVV